MGRSAPSSGARGFLGRAIALCLLALLCGAAESRADVLGDLDGNGAINSTDVQWLGTVYGTALGAPKYDQGADLNVDQRIDFRDLAILAANFGKPPTPVPPATILLTVDRVPDDMNNLLAVPPSGFTVDFMITNPPGAPLISVYDTSLVATEPAGAWLTGANLAFLFETTPSGASWKVDAQRAFPARNVFFTLQVHNRHGDVIQPPTYGVAVRNWAVTPPIGTAQKAFLDFGQDRDGIGGNDFDEDLRAFGLGSLSGPSLSATVRATVIARALADIRAFYGQNADGTLGTDPVTVAFSSTTATGATRICVGGEDPTGGVSFGLTPYDKNNVQTYTDTCALSPNYGIFPREFLYFQGNPNFQAAFNPLRSAAGGVPVGEHPLDATVLAAGFDPSIAPPAEAARWSAIDTGVSTFSRFVATITAHEAGHTLGLTASGAAPGGLWGGYSGAGAYHDLTVTGGIPTQNYLMKQGSGFTYEQIVGAAGTALPWFREIDAAYLRNQLMLKSNITAFNPPPALTSVTPNPAVYAGGTATIMLHGANFYGTPLVLLRRTGVSPKQVQNITLINASTLQGTINQFQVGTGTFDVEVTNPDDQQIVLPGGLTVQ